MWHILAFASSNVQTLQFQALFHVMVITKGFEVLYSAQRMKCDSDVLLPICD